MGAPIISLIQRPRRKQHLAVTRPGATTWDTIGSCRLTIPIDGATITALGEGTTIGSVAEQDVNVCVHCLHLIAFARVLEQGQLVVRHLQAVAS
jgi:hypothetical protein